MPLTKKALNDVLILTSEVAQLVSKVEHERQNVHTREYEEPAGADPGGWTEVVKEYGTHPGYTKASAALKRRSMDLTRALADLRKAD